MLYCPLLSPLGATDVPFRNPRLLIAAQPSLDGDASVNSLLSAAESLFALCGVADKKTQEEIRTSLAAQAMHVELGDLTQMDTMLYAHAQILHIMFTHAARKFADAKDESAIRIYGALALRAQACARKAVEQLARTAKPRHHSMLGQDFAKLRNEPSHMPPTFGNVAHIEARLATMNTKGKGRPATPEEWLAAIKKHDQIE